jgi:hypothetical protein
VIENLLNKVYKYIQKYTANEENSENNKNNHSADNFNYENNYIEKLSVNKSNPLINEKNFNFDNMNDPRVRKILDEKDMRIEELKNIIDVYYYLIYKDFGDEIKKLR